MRSNRSGWFAFLVVAIAVPATTLSCASLRGGQEGLSFSVTPRRICTGDPVTIRWSEADGYAILSSEPSLSGLGEVDEDGSLRLRLRDTTLVRMTVVSGEDTTRARQEVAVFRDGQQKELVFPTSPAGDTALIATDTLRDEVWGNTVRVGTVASHAGRTVTLLHSGIRDVLAADSTPSDVWAGRPMSGAWELAAPVVSGERMGDPDRAPPARLYLLATVQCRAQ